MITFALAFHENGISIYARLYTGAWAPLVAVSDRPSPDFPGIVDRVPGAYVLHSPRAPELPVDDGVLIPLADLLVAGGVSRHDAAQIVYELVANRLGMAHDITEMYRLVNIVYQISGLA